MEIDQRESVGFTFVVDVRRMREVFLIIYSCQMNWICYSWGVTLSGNFLNCLFYILEKNFMIFKFGKENFLQKNISPFLWFRFPTCNSQINPPLYVACCFINLNKLFCSGSVVQTTTMYFPWQLLRRIATPFFNNHINISTNNLHKVFTWY